MTSRQTHTYTGVFTSIRRQNRDGRPYRNGHCETRFHTEDDTTLWVKGRVPTYMTEKTRFKITVTEGDSWRGMRSYWFVRADLVQAKDARATLSQLLRTVHGIGPFKSNALIQTLGQEAKDGDIGAVLDTYVQHYEKARSEPTRLKTLLAPISKAVGHQEAGRVLEAWRTHNGLREIFSTTHWLQQFGLDEEIANKIMKALERLCKKKNDDDDDDDDDDDACSLFSACQRLKKEPYLLVIRFQQSFAFIDWRVRYHDGTLTAFNAQAPERLFACALDTVRSNMDKHMMIPLTFFMKASLDTLAKRGDIERDAYSQFVQDDYDKCLVLWKHKDALSKRFFANIDSLVHIQVRDGLQEYVTTSRRWRVASHTIANLRRLGLRHSYVPSSHVTRASAADIQVAFGKAIGAPATLAQVAVIQHMLDSPITILQGYPGTGKSTVVGVFVKMLHATQHWRDKDGDSDDDVMDEEEPKGARNVEVHLLAPTGMAARRLGEAAGNATLGKTLHMAINNIKAELERNPQVNPEPMFRFGAERTVIVIDEMSMVSALLFCTFLRTLHTFATKNELYKGHNVQLVLVGDSKQLPPIDAGLPFKNLLDHVPPAYVYTLKRVHRTENDPTQHLALLAERLRQLPYKSTSTCTKAWFEGVPLLSPAFRFINLDKHYDSMVDIVVNYVKKRQYKANDYHFQVICPRNADAAQWNNVLKDIMNPYVQDSNAVVYKPSKRREETIQRGDRVIFTRNHYEKNLRNGCVGTVNNVTVANKNDYVVTVRFCDLVPEEPYTDVELSSTVMISKVSGGSSLSRRDEDDEDVGTSVSELSQLHLAYAISVHKAQGGQYDDVIIYAGEGVAHNTQFYNRPLLYTGFTRGKRCVKLISSVSKIDTMLRMPLPPRLTILPFWLQHAQSPKLIRDNQYRFE